MKIIITGGTGFTGKRVLPLLKDQGHSIRCLTRTKDNFNLIEKYGFEPYQCDVKNLSSLQSAFKDFDALINIMSLGFGDAPNLISAIKQSSIKRALFVSTTAIETKLNAKTKIIRLDAEEKIKELAIRWTILRPTMIFGDIDDRNIIKLIKFLKKMPFVIIPGTGNFMQQPIDVKDVADAIVNAFFSDNTYSKTYNVSGANPLTFNDLIKTTATALQVKRPILHLPVTPIIWIFSLLEKIMTKPPLKAEQILRLLEDKNFSHIEASKDFEFKPKEFKDVIEREIKQLHQHILKSTSKI